MLKRNYIRNMAIATLILAIGATTTQAARVLWSETSVDVARPDTTSDPVEKQTRRETLAQIPELRQKPAPFVRIPIPDPLENQRLIGLREQPADNDAPLSSTGTPPRPVLPVAPPPPPPVPPAPPAK